MSTAALEAKQALADYLNSAKGRERQRNIDYRKRMAKRDYNEDPETEQEREERIEGGGITEVPNRWEA